MGRKPKRINISKIAKEVGVSESTISRALNHRAMVSESTRKKINEIIKKYNFTLTPARPREKKIALLAGSSSFTEYVSEVFSGIYEYATENALNTTIIFKNGHSKQKVLEQIRDQQCSGVVVIMPAEFNDALDDLAASDIPVILVDEAVYKEGIGFIDHDSYFGSREAAQYLLNLGHRKIGYIQCGYNTLNHIQRFKGYENAMKEANAAIEPDWVIKTDIDSNCLIENSFVKMQELLKRAPEITAVMTSNDDVAMGAIKGAQKMGRKVPEDVSIIGFDNYRQTKFLSPALTTVNHPIEEAGFLATKSAHEFLKNPKTEKLPQEILPTKLIIRESTCTPKQSSN